MICLSGYTQGYLKAKRVPGSNGGTLLRIPMKNMPLISKKIGSSSSRMSRIHDPVANSCESSLAAQPAESREATGGTHLSPAE